MRSFQTVLVIFMAAMLNMAHSAPGIHATAMALTISLVDTVTSSGFQHSVVSTPVHSEASLVSMRLKKQTGGCFHDSNFTRAENDTPTWIPWTALANQYDPGSEMALFYTFTTLCERISATIMTRDIPYTQCELDSYTNGTYGIIAQMRYLGPHDTFDMRGLYDYCMGALSLTKECEYGGWFDEIHFWHGPPDNNSQLWNVKARPIVGPCPDCTGGLLDGAA